VSLGGSLKTHKANQMGPVAQAAATPLACSRLDGIMRRPACLLVCFALAATAASLQVPVCAQAAAHEARAAHAYQAAMHAGPPALRAFLDQFPKGADLHIHLSGAVYAESFIREAGEDGLCVDPAALSFAQPPCAPPLVPAAQLSGNLTPAAQQLYDRLIDAFSMRGFVAISGFSGHDQFFSTFNRFGGLGNRHTGEWVDEVASRAAAENEQYVELMETPAFAHAARLAQENPLGQDSSREEFARYRQKLFALGLREEIPADRELVRAAEAQRRQIERCGSPQAVPACRVEVRYIYQVLRGFPPGQVFAQTLLGFETIQASMDSASKEAHEPGFVGLNFVQPEDGFISMRDYTLQMKMLDYLHSVYPRVHISLHAGELAPGLVPPEGLRFHIRQAVELGHAERIGHGVDVMNEQDAPGLLREMAQKHVMVEINLSSNEGILGVKGADHPFPLYRAAHVPVALSTDDEGVSRIDITHEYLRAALDYRLGYQDLKQLARTGLEHSFLAGASLWAAPDSFTIPAAACKAQPLGQDRPTVACKSFLDGSEKAAAQWELERRFREFEARF
jgi:adenosine deaminase